MNILIEAFVDNLQTINIAFKSMNKNKNEYLTLFSSEDNIYLSNIPSDTLVWGLGGGYSYN